MVLKVLKLYHSKQKYQTSNDQMELFNKVQVIFTAQKTGYKQSYISSSDPKIKLANSRNNHLPFIRCNQIYKKDKHLDINHLGENQKSHQQLLQLFNTQNIRDKSFITKNTLENSKLNKSQITSYYGTQQQNIDINKYGRTILINQQSKQTKKRSLIIQNQNAFDNFRRRSLFYNDQNNCQQLIHKKKCQNYKSLKTPKFSSSSISNYNQQKITNSNQTQDIIPLFLNKNLTFGQIIGNLQYDKSMDLNQRDAHQSDICLKNISGKPVQGSQHLSKRNYQRGIIGLMSPKNNLQRKSYDNENQGATSNSKISYYVQKNQQAFINQFQAKSKIKNKFQQNYNKNIQHSLITQKNKTNIYKNNYAQLSKQKLHDFQNYSSSKKHDLENHHFFKHKQNIHDSQISDQQINLQAVIHTKDNLPYKRYSSTHQQKNNIQYGSYDKDYKQKQTYSEDEKQLAYYKIQLEKSKQRQRELQQMLNQQIRHSSQLQRQLLRSIKKSDVIEKSQTKTDKKQLVKQNVNKKQTAKQFKEACESGNALVYFVFMLILMIKYGNDANTKHY